ncbi:MAG: hypothetical protein BA871_10630 [Desulfuromonadales bacterium C00003096]|jgi:hypothetical protein|nr:MAG: hypothetical protein BA871_10630 [Desulfuromonadales bacterium C00003096]
MGQTAKFAAGSWIVRQPPRFILNCPASERKALCAERRSLAGNEQKNSAIQFLLAIQGHPI